MRAKMHKWEANIVDTSMACVVADRSVSLHLPSGTKSQPKHCMTEAGRPLLWLLRIIEHCNSTAVSRSKGGMELMAISHQDHQSFITFSSRLFQKAFNKKYDCVRV